MIHHSTFLIVAVLAAALRGAEPVQQPIFVAGQGNYHTYRIPSVIQTKQHTLLAFCEGRKAGRSDAGDIDLVLRRSFDGGQTWQPTQVVWDDGVNTCGNPCPVVDQRDGTIWLLLTHNLGGDNEAEIIDGRSAGSRTCWVSHSRDDGATWAKPAEITPTVKKPNWTWYATGPGIGIQLTDGRLVIPCDNKVAVTKARQSHIIYSDDHGATWQLGGVVGPNCNESQIIARRDGSLLLNMRSYEANHRRLLATSSDRGASWSAPMEDPVLVEPVCQASLITYQHGNQSLVLFSNPASLKREKLTIRVSRDDGKSWQESRILYDGPAAYSCLTALPDGQVGCLYERGTKDAYESINWASVDLAWLLSR